MHVLSSAEFFSKLIFLKKSFMNEIRVSNSLDTDQARRIVGPDLDPNCLPRLSADDTGRETVFRMRFTTEVPSSNDRSCWWDVKP